MNRSGSRFQHAAVATIAVAFALIAAMFATALNPVHQASAADAFLPGGAVTVATDRLNIRVRPGLDEAISTAMLFGETVFIAGGPVSADGYSWYQIVRTGANTQVGGPNGWVAGEYLEQTGWAPGTEVEVTDGPVNIRPASSTGQDPIGSLEEGATIVVTAGPVSNGGYHWYKFTLETGGVGWVAGEFLGTATPGSDDGGIGVGDGVRVSDGPVNFRAEPGLDSEILAVVPEGELFAASDNQVVADGYTWVHVFNYGRGQGWIATAFLSVDPNGFPGEEGA